MANKAKEHGVHFKPCREIKMEHRVFLVDLPDLTLMLKITRDLSL